MQNEQKHTVETDDKYQINLVYQTVPAPSGAVILCHGITSNLHESGLFDELTVRLIEKNINVVRFDFRGHGNSSGSSKDVTLNGESLDLDAVYRWLLSQSPSFERKHAIVATSFSCNSAIRHSLAHPPLLLSLINPVFDYRRTFVEPETTWGRSIKGTTSEPGLPVGVTAFIPGKEFFISDRLWKEMETDDTPSLATRLRYPTIAFHGTSDTKVPIDPILEFVASHNGLINLQTFDGEDHGLKRVRPIIIDETVTAIQRGF